MNGTAREHKRPTRDSKFVTASIITPLLLKRLPRPNPWHAITRAPARYRAHEQPRKPAHLQTDRTETMACRIRTLSHQFRFHTVQLAAAHREPRPAGDGSFSTR